MQHRSGAATNTLRFSHDRRLALKSSLGPGRVMKSPDLGLVSAPASAPTSDAWDRAAQGWNQHAALIRVWLREVTAAMLDAACLAPGSRVLDIAAGAGGQTLDIAHRVGPQGRVLATDLSARILALAKDNARAAGLTQVDTRVADAQALGLAGADFDAAVCRLGLMFCQAPHSALAEVCAALRPGGRFSALVFSQPQFNPCLAVMMSTALRHAGLPAKSPFEPGSLMSLSKQLTNLSAPPASPTGAHPQRLPQPPRSRPPPPT